MYVVSKSPEYASWCVFWRESLVDPTMLLVQSGLDTKVEAEKAKKLYESMYGDMEPNTVGGNNER